MRAHHAFSRMPDGQGVEPGYRLRIRQMPTIGPRDGMPVTVRAAR